MVVELWTCQHCGNRRVYGAGGRFSHLNRPKVLSCEHCGRATTHKFARTVDRKWQQFRSEAVN